MADEPVNDPVAEATALVMAALANPPEGGIAMLGGVITTFGRLVIPLAADAVEDFEGPLMQHPEDAIAWILQADREDAYAVRELGNAILNWKRNAHDADVTVADLRELGDDLINALTKLIPDAGDL